MKITMRKSLIFSLMALLGGAVLYHLIADNPETGNSDSGESVHEQALVRVDESELDRSSQAPPVSYADMLDKTRPAVVSIASTRIVRVRDQQRRQSPMEDFLRRFYGLPAPQPEEREGGEEFQERRLPNSLGSGVIVSSNGYILTNNHVVVDDRDVAADEVMVTLSGGREYPATVVGRDARTDVALLKIDAVDLPYLPIANSDQLRVGDVVFAIGNPFGLEQTVSMGIVSATGRSRLGILGSQGYEDFIQTDASINPGNSGGALVDAKGRLVGLNTAIFSRTGGNIGIGFAIPVNMARFIMENLIERGIVPRGYLGVQISDLDRDLAEAFNLPNTDGVLIENVMEGHPAEMAGLRRGDVVVAVNDRPVREVSELRLMIAQLMPGTTAELTVIREEEEIRVPVVLGSLDGDEAEEEEIEPVFEGVTVIPLDERMRQEHQIQESHGLVVTEVDRTSMYRNTLRPGMVILEINDQKVESVAEARATLRSGRINKLYVSFRGNRGFIALRAP